MNFPFDKWQHKGIIKVLANGKAFMSMSFRNKYELKEKMKPFEGTGVELSITFDQ